MARTRIIDPGRHEWWDGILASPYKVALPLGLRATPLSL